MKSIAYVIPYFGKLPNNFPLWLVGCEKNPTVDWLIFTDDKTQYSYPDNVKVTYMSFDDMRNKIQSIYDFPISMERPYKLCDFKVAYGEIFEDELQGYDFWGHCDLDLMFGNIRKFLTDDILEKYDKIGDQGHSTLYRNNSEINSLYRRHIDGVEKYENILSSNKNYVFDEQVICNMYKAMGKEYYNETNYAHLNKYESSFYLGHLTKDDVYKNKRQAFGWKDGTLTRYYLYNNKVDTEEFMYIHFWCRPITYKIKKCSSKDMFVMYPDVVRKYDRPIDIKFLKRHGHKGKIPFLIKTMIRNRKKITPKRIIFNIKSFSGYRKRDVR